MTGATQAELTALTTDLRSTRVTPDMEARVLGPRRVRLSRAKGWRIPHATIVVARPTRWGNPFVVGAHIEVQNTTGCRRTVHVSSRTTAVAFYETWLRGFWSIPSRERPRPREIRDWLAGQNLACWCAEGDSCHSDVLLEIANGARS